MTEHVVAIERVSGSYPDAAPFHPGERYPEYAGPVAPEPNDVFGGVRRLLVQLGLDAPRFGTPEWNPLGGVVEPGQTVFIKPNMVDDRHRHGGDLWSVVTHPSVVRALAEYVAIALRGRGRIVIGDNPHVDCDWRSLSERYAPALLAEHFERVHGVRVELVDLRQWHVRDLRYYGFKRGRAPLAGDPRGTVAIDLGKRSLLEGVPWWLVRGTYNERLETILAHTRGRHRYELSRSIFDADAFISVPKLKSHAKVGATLNVKGLIGTVANKNGLVHWRLGFPGLGGDEYPEPERRSDYVKLYAQHLLWTAVPSTPYFHLRNRLLDTPAGRAWVAATRCEAQRARMLRGAWEGNDTIWRMAVDVYNAFVADVTGARGPMKFFSVVDGVIGGEEDGPHFPAPKSAGLLVGGADFLSVDRVALRLMDYRVETVRYLDHLLREARLSDRDITVRSSSYPVEGFFDPERRHLDFRPPHRWPHLPLHDAAPLTDRAARRDE